MSITTSKFSPDWIIYSGSNNTFYAKQATTGKEIYSGSYAAIKNSVTGSLSGSIFDNTLNRFEGYQSGGILQSFWNLTGSTFSGSTGNITTVNSTNIYTTNLSGSGNISGSTIVASQGLRKGFSYIVYSGSGLGGPYFAENGNTGKVEYTGSDLSTVLQYANNSIITSGGSGSIHISGGHFIPLTPFFISGSVEVYGEGPGRTIIQAASNTNYNPAFWYISAQNNISVHDLTLDGNNYNNTNQFNLLDFSGSTSCRVYNLEFKDAPWSGLKIFGDCQYMDIRDCFGNNPVIQGFSINGCLSSNFDNLKVIGMTGSGYSAFDFSYVRDSNISNLYGEGTDACLKIDEGDNTGSDFCKRLNISNVILKNISGSQVAITVDSVQDSSFSNININGGTGSIRIANASQNLNFNGGNISGSNGYGIYCTSQVSNIKVSNYNFNKISGTALSCDGHNSTFAFNTFTGSQNAISNLGNNNLWYGNGVLSGSVVVGGKNVVFKDNRGFNPFGYRDNIFDSVNNYIELAGNTGSPAPSTTYTVNYCDVYLKSTGDNSCSILIKDKAGNIFSSGSTIASYTFIPIGWTITWGAFTGSDPHITAFFM